MDNPFAAAPAPTASGSTATVDLPVPPGTPQVDPLATEVVPDQNVAPLPATPAPKKPRATRTEPTADHDPSTVPGVAYDGGPARKPGPARDVLTRSSRIRSWLDTYEPLQMAPEDLERVNREIYTVSRAMTELERIYSEIADLLLAAELRHGQARNRAVLATSGSTAGVRDAYADIMVEDLHAQAAELKTELTRVERAVRLTAKHQDALLGIGHNLRAIIKP